MQVTCNLCGCERFAEMNGRPRARCESCGSLERTRVLKLMLDAWCDLRAGSRIFHLAPERGIYESISKVAGVDYKLVDLHPEAYSFAPLERFDVALDVERLPSRRYDIVIHSHVMEHVPCNVTAALYHLHRSLTDGGTHLFSVPITGEAYECDLGHLSDSERARRFGQDDHYRRFGAKDMHRTLGMVFRLPQRYELTDHFPAEMLDRYSIPSSARSGFTSHSVFCLKKADLKLSDVA
jgi:Methyltransferase domain